MISALKQSLSAHLPTLNHALELKEFLQLAHSQIILAHCHNLPKKFIGQLRFQELGRTAAMTTALPTLVSAIAMQQQMAAIERRLAAVQEQLDALVEDRRIELEAGLDTNLEILEDVARRVRRRDELEPSQWQRVTAIESDVRSFQKRTWAALAQLTTALDPERPAATRTKELAGLVRNDGLTRQLVQLVKAEVALARWQGLQLLHDAQEHPEELEERTEQFLADTRGRHQHLVVLARRMDAYLGAGAGASLRDRARARMRGDAPARNAADPERLAWSALCQALFLSAEFRTVD